MKKNKKESIYQYINRMAQENPGLPYSFQIVDIAGKIDVNYVLWDDGLPATVKERLAMEVMDKVEDCIKKSNNFDELRELLKKKSVFLYMTKLTDRLQLLLSEKLIDEKLLYSFAIWLATESEYEEEVKLGILILGFFENDLTRQIIRTLGFHSALTIYAVEASKNFACQNEFLYQLLQNTRGYGKLAVLSIFKPVQHKQQSWIFEEGAINEIAPNMSSIMCLEKVDMAKYYLMLNITESNFSKLSYLLAYASEANDIKVFTQSFVLVEKYMNVAEVYSKSFIDLAAIVVIEKSMLPYWYDEEDVEKENGWSSSKENIIRDKCCKLLKQPKWKNVLLQEMNMPYQQTSLIMLVLKKIGIVPEFEILIPLLQKDLFDMDILEFVLIDNPEYYLKDVMIYLSQVIPKEVICEDPQEIAEESITPEYKPDIWLVYLLKALRRRRQNEETLFIRCMTSRFPDVRIESIHALRVFKNEWSGVVLTAIEHAYDLEPIKSIKKRLQRLMGKKDDKEQRYVDVAEIKVVPSPWDLCLLTTNIAGVYYRDMLVVEGRIENGDILYLMREPENKYDSKAILVTTDDGYVLGYVPRVDNAIPASLMDSGEKIYAIFKSENLENIKPNIQIMLSKRPKKVGTVIKFPILK